MISVVTFKWKPRKGYRSVFGPAAVNIMRRMVLRHYRAPHRFICVTDDPEGLDPEVEVVPLWEDHAKVQNPHGPHQPSCYRRLKVFDPQMANVLGTRFVCIDLDTVIVGDMRPVWDRQEPFVIWGETDPRSWYNGSMFLTTAGARAQLWQEFDPEQSPKAAYRDGKFGSDQGWISYRLGPGEATWSKKDGVYSYRVHLENKAVIPENARVIMFHGHIDPWHHKAQKLAWVREHYQ